MKNERILTVFLALIVSVGMIGGCNNNGGKDSEIPGGVDPSVFDLSTAIDLAELSLVAYEQRTQCIDTGKDAITVPAPYKLEKVIFESVSGFFNSSCKDDDGIIPISFIATMDKSIYLVFRGTANIADALSDLAVDQETYNYIPDAGKVSGGFQETYEGDDTNPIESTILTELDKLIATGNYDSLYITGHSLGAALAVVAFPDLSVNTSISNVFMYNFAGPAVGNSDFTSKYESLYGDNHASFRVVNTNDLVPELPPLGLDCTDLMYEHVSGEHQITFGTALPPLPDFSKDDCDTDTIAGQILTYGLNNKSDIEENHSVCTYFMTLCDKGPDKSTCEQRAIGCD